MEYFKRDVETCCFCCNLRTGNIVLGVTNAIFSGLGTFLVFLFLSVASEDPDESTSYSAGAIIIFLLLACKFIFDVMFVYGVVKSNPKIVKAYATMYLVFMCIWMAAMFVSLIMLEWGHFFNLLIHLAFDGYAYIVCRSLHHKLETQEIV